MEYPDTLGRIKAVWDKLGGEEGVEALLSGELVVVRPQYVHKPPVLKIDRTQLFEPAECVGHGFTVWRGDANGDGLGGAREEDARSVQFSEINPSQIMTLTGILDTETRITCEERRRRLLHQAILLDGQVAKALLSELQQFTLNWLYSSFGVTRVELLGTTLRSVSGIRHSLQLCRQRATGFWIPNTSRMSETRDKAVPTLCVAV